MPGGAGTGRGDDETVGGEDENDEDEKEDEDKEDDDPPAVPALLMLGPWSALLSARSGSLPSSILFSLALMLCRDILAQDLASLARRTCSLRRFRPAIAACFSSAGAWSPRRVAATMGTAIIPTVEGTPILGRFLDENVWEYIRADATGSIAIRADAPYWVGLKGRAARRR